MLRTRLRILGNIHPPSYVTPSAPKLGCHAAAPPSHYISTSQHDSSHQTLSRFEYSDRHSQQPIDTPIQPDPRSFTQMRTEHSSSRDLSPTFQDLSHISRSVPDSSTGVFRAKKKSIQVTATRKKSTVMIQKSKKSVVSPRSGASILRKKPTSYVWIVSYPYWSLFDCYPV